MRCAVGIKKEADGLFYLLPADKKYSFDGITECEKLGLRLAQPKTRVSMDVAKQYNAGKLVTLTVNHINECI